MNNLGSLTEEILKRADLVSFHTPSHAGKLSKESLLCDVTELFYTDNLLSPEGRIDELERIIASAYGAEACFISTQGATHNVFQAVFACLNRGAFLVVGKAHASVYNALRTFKAKTYHVDSLGDEIPECVKTIIFTSPDYFGNVVDLRSLCLKAKEKGLTTIVDASHGSHFIFGDNMPDSATLYADLVIHSLHKTLPVVTGGSVLLCKNEYKSHAKAARKTLHTTSPNYMVLCSIERAIKDFSENGRKYYGDIEREVKKARRILKFPFYCEENDDFSRLVITSPFDGKSLYNKLVERGFCAETAYKNKVVFIINPFNYMHVVSLVKAVNEAKDLEIYDKADFPSKAHPNPTLIEFGYDFEEISFSEAEGRKVYNEIGFYPPGVPFLYSGEEIKREHIEWVKAYLGKADFFGSDGKKVFVVKK